MEEKLLSLFDLENPWTKCTFVGVDNISVNLRTRNFLKGLTVQWNSVIYFNVCPCHIEHNAAQNGGAAFARVSGFDAEEFAVYLY